MPDDLPEIITFSLIENAIDFLHSAVAYVKTKDEHDRGFKYGVLHLCDGIELLLKCRLNAEHWSLVVDDIDKTTPKDIASGDFKSVAWQEAITRVEKCTKQPFTDADRSLLDHLRKQRNRVQHFDVKMNRDECNSLLAAGLQFATTFVESHLPTENLGEELREIREDLARFEEFVAIRLKAIQPQIDDATKYGIVVLCPRCRQETLHADAGRSRCFFCGYDEDGNTAAYDWVTEFGGPRRMKDEAAEPSVEDCPECSATAAVLIARYLPDSYDGPRHFCFACGQDGDYSYCSSCGLLFDAKDDATMCSDCWRAPMMKDD